MLSRIIGRARSFGARRDGRSMARTVLSGRAPLIAVLDVVAPVGLYYGLRAAGAGIYLALLAGAVVPGISMMIRLVRGVAFDRLAVFVMTTMLIGVGVAVIAGSPRFLLAKEGWVTAVGGVWFLLSARGAQPLAFLYRAPAAGRQTSVHERAVEQSVGAPSAISARVARVERDLGCWPARRRRSPDRDRVHASDRSCAGGGRSAVPSHVRRAAGDRPDQLPALWVVADPEREQLRVGGVSGQRPGSARPLTLATRDLAVEDVRPATNRVFLHAAAARARPIGGDVSVPRVLVGRDRERSAIDRLLADAHDGLSGSLVVRGEAGFGKTALLGYAADSAQGMRVLRVTGARAERDLAFAGLHALLWPIIEELPRVPPPQRSALGAALGVADGEGHDRFLVSAGVLSLLAAAAEAGPIVCLVDDAQWLDVPSSDSLLFTARRIVAEGLVILFGVREGELQRFDDAGVEQLVLGGLDRESATSLLSRSAPTAVASVRQRLLAEAAGNPLALLELSSALTDTQLAGRSRLPRALPLTARLTSAFMQRIKRLPDPSQEALLVAAAENTGELQVIRAAAAELALPADALEPADQLGIVTTQDAKLTFRHPLIRSAVYESATIGRRHEVHAALAGVLAGAGQADRAVWHRAMATDARNEEIAGALEASARQSQNRGGHASAASAYERAAELSERESLRTARLARAATAAWLAGQAERASDLINRVLPDAVPSERARLLYLRGLIEGRRGWLKQGVGALRRAAELSDDATLSLQILREAGSMAVYASDYDEVIAIGTSAAELSPATDVDRYAAAALGAYAADLSGDFALGAELATKALHLADRLNDPMCLISAAATVARHGLAADGLRLRRSRSRDRSRAGAGDGASIRASGPSSRVDRLESIRPGLLRG